MLSNNDIGITPDWFTPDGQKCKEIEKRSFKWVPMDGWQAMEIAREFYGGNLSIEGMRIALKYGLVDWKNIKDPVTGELIEFSNEKFGVVATDDLIALACKIVSASHLSEEQQKN